MFSYLNDGKLTSAFFLSVLIEGYTKRVVQRIISKNPLIFIDIFECCVVFLIVLIFIMLYHTRSLRGCSVTTSRGGNQVKIREEFLEISTFFLENNSFLYSHLGFVLLKRHTFFRPFDPSPLMSQF